MEQIIGQSPSASTFSKNQQEHSRNWKGPTINGMGINSEIMNSPQLGDVNQSNYNRLGGNKINEEMRPKNQSVGIEIRKAEDKVVNLNLPMKKKKKSEETFWIRDQKEQRRVVKEMFSNDDSNQRQVISYEDSLSFFHRNEGDYVGDIDDSEDEIDFEEEEEIFGIDPYEECFCEDHNNIEHIF